jgi:hypothetical protein
LAFEQPLTLDGDNKVCHHGFSDSRTNVNQGPITMRNARSAQLPSRREMLKRMVGGALATGCSGVLRVCVPGAEAAHLPHVADWLKDARLGVFMHFLPGDPQGLAKVDDFDVPAVTRQLKAMGASYFILTLGQNSGFFNTPNAVYDQVVGIAPGERCSRRDLPLDLHRALQPAGIPLMLYLPCQTPNADRRAQRAFGLPEGRRDQPLTEEFAHQWAKVIHEWSSRYGDKVAGWWFDGGYQHIRFSESIARIYADAVKRGNPKAIVTFNPGIRLVRHTRAEDYTAGELNEPFTVLPASRWVDGSQWHALTYLGSAWGRRDTRQPTERWVEWVRTVVAKGGAVTLDMGPNWDPAVGPIGTFDEAQVAQFSAIRQGLATVESR